METKPVNVRKQSETQPPEPPYAMGDHAPLYYFTGNAGGQSGPTVVVVS